MSDSLFIRKATADDAPALMGMLRELAEFEKLSDKFEMSQETLYQELAHQHPTLHCVIAFLDGEAVGMISYFETFTTFAGKRGLYLEDIYVRVAARQQGVGTAMLRFVAKVAVENDYGRVEWTTLLWNTAALEFYESMGAMPNDAWTTYRLTGDWLRRLAGQFRQETQH